MLQQLWKIRWVKCVTTPFGLYQNPKLKRNSNFLIVSECVKCFHCVFTAELQAVNSFVLAPWKGFGLLVESYNNTWIKLDRHISTPLLKGWSQGTMAHLTVWFMRVVQYIKSNPVFIICDITDSLRLLMMKVLLNNRCLQNVIILFCPQEMWRVVSADDMSVLECAGK